MAVPDVAVIVVGFNSRDDVSELFDDLEEVCRSSRYQVGVVFVDNGSTDGSAEFAMRQHPSFLVRAEGVNLGFPAANNIGIRALPARRYLLLNPDTRILPEQFDRLIAAADALGAGICGPRILRPDGSVQPSCFRRPSVSNLLAETLHLPLLPRLFPKWFRRAIEAKDEQPSVVPVLLGAAVLLSAECVERVGFLGEDYFWMEFSEYCLRAEKAGFASYHIPAAYVIHKEGTTRKRFKLMSSGAYLLSERRYFRECGTPLQYRLILGGRRLELLSKCAVLGTLAIAGLSSPDRARTMERLCGVYLDPDSDWTDLS